MKRKRQLEYKVEKILQHRVNRCKNEYLIRWKGYGPKEDIWKPQTNVETDSHELIKEHHNQRGDSASWEIKAQTLVLKDDTDFDRWKFCEVKHRDSTLQVQLNKGIIPKRGSAKAAGFDLNATQNTTIPANKTVAVSTGIQIKVPIGTYGQIAEQSSIALKNIHVGGGVIDRDYTGEIRVILVNNSNIDFVVNIGDCIAQLVLERITIADIQVMKSLTETLRRDKEFGSTGKWYSSQRSSN